MFFCDGRAAGRPNPFGLVMILAWKSPHWALDYRKRRTSAPFTLLNNFPFYSLEEAEEKERSRVLAEIWTAKEAYGKALGTGLFGGLSEIQLMNREKAGDIYLKQFRIYRDKEEFILTAALLGEKITDNEPVFCEILL